MLASIAFDGIELFTDRADHSSVEIFSDAPSRIVYLSSDEMYSVSFRNEQEIRAHLSTGRYGVFDPRDEGDRAEGRAADKVTRAGAQPTYDKSADYVVRLGG